MKGFSKKANLNAPRFRKKTLVILNQQFYKDLIVAYPELAYLSAKQIKKAISVFNGAICETAKTYRDGVELPKQLGNIFVGSCQRNKSYPGLYRKGREGVKIENKIGDSDQYTCKIFYTNYETKYQFANSYLWGFKAHRDFTRSVGGKNYEENWMMYRKVDPWMKISRMFRMQKEKLKTDQELPNLLAEYDEFDFDT